MSTDESATHYDHDRREYVEYDEDGRCWPMPHPDAWQTYDD